MNIEERMKQDADQRAKKEAEVFAHELREQFGLLYGNTTSPEAKATYIALDGAIETLRAQWEQMRAERNLKILQDGLFAAAVEMGRGDAFMGNSQDRQIPAFAPGYVVGAEKAEAPVDRSRVQMWRVEEARPGPGEVMAGEGREDVVCMCRKCGSVL